MTDATPKEVDPESEVSKQVDTIKTWALKLIPVAFTIVSAFTAYAGAGSKAGHAKDSSEAGFQSVDKWVKHLDETDRVLIDRVAKLEAELTEIKRKVKAMPVRRTPEPARPAPPPVAAAPVIPVPPPPPPLPANLDKALEQQQKTEAAK